MTSKSFHWSCLQVCVLKCFVIEIETFGVSIFNLSFSAHYLEAHNIRVPLARAKVSPQVGGGFMRTFWVRGTEGNPSDFGSFFDA